MRLHWLANERSMTFAQCLDVGLQMNRKVFCFFFVPSSYPLKKQRVNFVYGPKVLYGPNISQRTVSSTWANTELVLLKV